jgi:hypothetical protein
MFLIRGILLAGQFRTQHQLNTISADGQRNTLITEIGGRTKQTNLQSFDNNKLAGIGAVLVYLRTSLIRSDADIKGMTADDMRNVLIVELGAVTGLSGPTLQGMSNMDLVLLGLGKAVPGNLKVDNFIGGVLLAGQFRTQHQLNTMSADDRRNTLIVELAGHSNQQNLQSFNGSQLAGAGALMLFLLKGGIRTLDQLKTLSVDDQRNIAIVEIGAQTNLGSKLQSLSNLDLVLTALGVDAVFPVIPPARFVFRVDSVDIRRQKADNDHSDSDWLTIVVTVGNPITKNSQTFPAKLYHIGGAIRTGNVILPNTDVAASGGKDFVTDAFVAGDGDIVTISYVLMNLGSSDAEDQFAQAVKISDKILQVVGPVAGAIIGTFFDAPEEGAQIGEQIAEGVDKAIKALSDFFDILGIHIGPANCNGEVLHDTLTFAPGEIAKALNQPASRDFTGPQENSRCGGAPESTVHFSVIHDIPPGGLFPTDA